MRVFVVAVDVPPSDVALEAVDGEVHRHRLPVSSAFSTP